MGLVALVMAGGRGIRMGGSEEKPLVKIRGKHMIDYVLDALKKVDRIDRIVVAVSRYTPQTARRMKELSVETFETPGIDFISDMRCAITELRLGPVLVVCADLPLLSSELIEDVLSRYERCGKPCLSVMASGESYQRLGFTTDPGIGALVPIGVNVIDGERIDEPTLEQENFVTDCAEICVNVNTAQDLERVESLLEKIEGHRPCVGS